MRKRKATRAIAAQIPLAVSVGFILMVSGLAAPVVYASSSPTGPHLILWNYDYDGENLEVTLKNVGVNDIYFASTSPDLSYFAIVGVGEEGPSENVPPSENVQFSNLRISPESVSPEEPVTISVDVTNLGENQVACPVTLRINGVLKDSETVTLDGGENETVDFTVTEGIPGTYDVEVDGQTGSFEVIEHEEGEPSGGPVLGIVMIAIVAVFVVVLLYGRRKWI